MRGAKGPNTTRLQLGHKAVRHLWKGPVRVFLVGGGHEEIHLGEDRRKL